MNLLGNPNLSFKGHKHTEEHKKRMSLLRKGITKTYKCNTEGLKLGRGWNKGKKTSLETRLKIKEARARQVISLETRKKMSQVHKTRREKHWNWQGGVNILHKTERQLAFETVEYRFWRKAVFERDRYQCTWCVDNTGGNLEADHIKKWVDYPDLRLVIDNGRTLCHNCHTKTDTYGNRRSTT